VLVAPPVSVARASGRAVPADFGRGILPVDSPTLVRAIPTPASFLDPARVGGAAAGPNKPGIVLPPEYLMFECLVLDLSTRFIPDAEIEANAKSSKGKGPSGQYGIWGGALMGVKDAPQTVGFSGSGGTAKTSPIYYCYRMEHKVASIGVCIWRQVVIEETNETWPIRAGDPNPIVNPPARSPCTVDQPSIPTTQNIMIDRHSFTLETPAWVLRQTKFRLQVTHPQDADYRAPFLCLDYDQTWVNFPGDAPPQRKAARKEDDRERSTRNQLFFDENGTQGILMVWIGKKRSVNCKC
jgi:hypothetical protein